MNQVVRIPIPPSLVKCKNCGAKYLLRPSFCHGLTISYPLSLRGWIAFIKNLSRSIKDDINGKERKEENNATTFKEIPLFACQICGGELERLWKDKNKSNKGGAL